MKLQLFVTDADTGLPFADIGEIESFAGWTHSARVRLEQWAKKNDTDQHGRRLTLTQLWAWGYGLHRVM